MIGVKLAAVLDFAQKHTVVVMRIVLQQKPLRSVWALVYTRINPELTIGVKLAVLTDFAQKHTVAVENRKEQLQLL